MGGGDVSALDRCSIHLDLVRRRSLWEPRQTLEPTHTLGAQTDPRAHTHSGGALTLPAPHTLQPSPAAQTPRLPDSTTRPRLRPIPVCSALRSPVVPCLLPTPLASQASHLKIPAVAPPPPSGKYGGDISFQPNSWQPDVCSALWEQSTLMPSMSASVWCPPPPPPPLPPRSTCSWPTPRRRPRPSGSAPRR